MHSNKINSGLILCLMLGGNLFFSACSEKKEKKETAIVISDTLIRSMKIGVAQIMQVRSELMLTGKVIADQSKQIQVYPLVGGIVKSLHFELGD